jgi:hypothetical protein
LGEVLLAGDGNRPCFSLPVARATARFTRAGGSTSRGCGIARASSGMSTRNDAGLQNARVQTLTATERLAFALRLSVSVRFAEVGTAASPGTR